MTAAILFVSCSQYENESQPDASAFQREAAGYSGVDIFKGVFFLQNDIADGIPQLRTIKNAVREVDRTKESMKELSDISVAFIGKHYPSFFNDLKAAMESGNLYEISEMIDFSGRLIEQAALSSERYHTAFLFGVEMRNNEELRTRVERLDLSTQEGVDELASIIDHEFEGNGGYETNAIPFVWAVVAAVYVIVGAVSIAVAAYSVYYKVAYWGPRVRSSGISSSLFRVGDNTISIEREVFVAQLGNFFAN